MRSTLNAKTIKKKQQTGVEDRSQPQNRKEKAANGIGETDGAATKAFKENYQELLENKKIYDPENRLRHNHNINK
ncbi:BBE domain-containing protein [Pseudoneobacillus sp. C159]